MNGIAQQLIAAYPDMTKDLVSVRVETFTDRFIGGSGRAMFLTVMGAVVFVLLIACANVANLLLSRTTARAREIAVRMAIGATRWRVVRQLLLESLLLSVIGGTIGLLLAIAGVRAFGVAMQESGLPYLGGIRCRLCGLCVCRSDLRVDCPALRTCARLVRIYNQRQ